MDAKEIKRLDREHHLHSWSVQKALDTLVVDRAEGACIWDAAGKRYLDFASQLVCVNAGHQHPKIVQAIKDQADKLCFIAPGVSYKTRSELVETLQTVTPGDLNHFFFTLGGAESNENAVKMARMYTGRHKILARYRSYHGATMGAITLTGDPRRPPVEPGIPGVVHFLDPYCYRCPFALTYPQCGVQCAKHLEEVVQYEGPQTIAAVIMESICGSNGIFVQPPEYLPMVREICDKYGIMMICDEVMTGFGRTGKWFGVDNWNVVPDMITMAKGLTSSYVPLGGVAVTKKISDYFQDHMLWAGLTYNAHPLACAAAVATINVYKDEKIIEHSAELGLVMMKEMEAMKARHACVGDVRGIGLFGIIELVKDKATKEALVPWNASGPAAALTKEITKRLLEGGVYPMTRWNWIFVTPPLVITEAELMEGLKVMDDVLSWVDTQLG